MDTNVQLINKQIINKQVIFKTMWYNKCSKIRTLWQTIINLLIYRHIFLSHANQKHQTKYILRIINTFVFFFK